MATTRFSKLWPCAEIRLGATLSLWRRVHCERVRVAPCTFLSLSRGRLRGSGVFEVCRGHVAGMPRRCAVGIGFGACCVHAWRTCVSRGRLRGSGVLEACRGHAAGMPRGHVAVLRRGDWRRDVLRARMILRDVTCVSRGRHGAPDACPRSGRQWRVDPRGRRGETCIWTFVRVRFAWQVWGKVASGGVANVDSRGRCGEACTQRAFRAAGVGNGATGGSLGILLRGRRRESCAAAETARFRGPVREFGCAGARSRSRRCEIVAGAGNPWICGCKLRADVSWNAAAGCVRRVARAALCRGMQWQAVGIGVGHVAFVASVAPCLGDC